MQNYTLEAKKKIQVVLIGTGKVAKSLGAALHRKEVHFAGVFGRNATRLHHIASMLETVPFDQLSKLPRDADLYFLAVSDDAVAEVSQQLGTVSGLVVHVSGSLPATILASSHERYGVFYPLQTFSDDRQVNFDAIPIFVQANNPQDALLLHHLATLLSQTVIESTDEMRSQLHLAAVFACNFVNALYTMSEGLLGSKNLDFNLLHPLIIETAQKATLISPELAQTGPARRGDTSAINNHLQLLENHPHEKAVYNALTTFLLEKYHSTKS
ncbi:MAG TPA: DUF2520 domain-containing protein [Bacteroidales bacterium]|nr:DUF2520 domain-containing protein [Bacteroidales bacterium]